jgi:Domain of unknown function (DUF3598)
MQSPTPSTEHPPEKNQWECFMQNWGTWEGSFSQLSTQGEVVEDVLSVLRLEGLENDKKARLTLRRFSPQNPPDVVQEYDGFSRGLLFFETGAFSQGGMQYSAYANPFGGEFALVQPDRRFRIVQLFTDGQLSKLVLMRERRSLPAGRRPSASPDLNQPAGPASVRPALQVEDLLGTWQGESITLFPDWRTPVRGTSTLTLEKQADRLVQTLNWGDRTISSTAQINGSVLDFNTGVTPVRVLLLPDGGSVSFPVPIPTGTPFFLEIGWLYAPGRRQRLMRQYDARGEWIGLTLITEQRIGF